MCTKSHLPVSIFEIVFLILLLFNLCFAQVEIADHYLEISPNARASAMGESGVGLADDVWAIFWNSAGYAFQQGSEVAITHAYWPIYSFPNYSINYISFKQPVKKLDGVIAGSISYENFGNYVGPQFGPVMSSSLRIHEMAFALGYSAKLLPTMGLGFNARYFYRSHLINSF